MRTMLAVPASSLILAAALFLSPSFARAVPNVNVTEGMWEMKGDVKYEGDMHVGGKVIHLKPVKLHYSQCLTKKDMAPYKTDKGQKCSKTSEKWSGNTVTWSIKCTVPNGITVEGNGSATFSGTAAEAKIHSVMTDAQGGKIKAIETIKGHRTGPCRKP